MTWIGIKKKEIFLHELTRTQDGNIRREDKLCDGTLEINGTGGSLGQGREVTSLYKSNVDPRVREVRSFIKVRHSTRLTSRDKERVSSPK